MAMQYFIPPVNTGLVHVIQFFPAERMGLSCSWKQLFAVSSTTEVKRKSFKLISSCRASKLVQLSDCY